jgi:hypothetical protein
MTKLSPHHYSTTTIFLTLLLSTHDLTTHEQNKIYQMTNNSILPKIKCKKETKFKNPTQTLKKKTGDLEVLVTNYNQS